MIILLFGPARSFFFNGYVKSVEALGRTHFEKGHGTTATDLMYISFILQNAVHFIKTLKCTSSIKAQFVIFSHI